MNPGHDLDLRLPRGDELKELLQLSREANIDDLLMKPLIEPLSFVLSRPRKNLRASLVDFGFSVAQDRGLIDAQHVDLAMNDAKTILETLHTGSLVIDDIQDGSSERRGAPAVHTIYGVPVALNAGNWLYFYPFRVIESMAIPAENKPALAREVQITLLRAHYGQALDVGISFDSVERARLPEVSAAAIELKTGALSGLACKIGMVACGADQMTASVLERFGKRFGIALQMYDDIGNVVSVRNEKKWLEDIRLKRVTFVAAVAAERLNDHEFLDLIRLVKDERFGEARTYLLDKGVIQSAKERAGENLFEALATLQREIAISASQIEFLEGLQRKLMMAYE